MMLQYRRIKQRHRDSVLFFRMGDFYEMFEDDAKEVSALLDLTLTKRNGIPMCGIPYHASDNYVSRLLKAGRKIAICEQTHIPKSGRKLATREVVEVLSPGTVVDESLLERSTNNYLAAIGAWKDRLSLSYIDLSTGEFHATAFSMEGRIGKLRKELYRLSPKEVILQESLLEEDQELARLLGERDNLVLNRYPDWYFDIETTRRELERQLGVGNLKGFGLKEDSPEIVSAGVLLEYIGSASPKLLAHIRHLRVDRDGSVVSLDEVAQRNLELVSNLQDGSRRYTLLEVLDHCRTSMGTRMLRRWILAPLRSKEEINRRSALVDMFYRNQILLSSLRDRLSSILDIERLASKIAVEKAHAKDLLSVRLSLTGIRELSGLLGEFPELAPSTEPLRAALPAVEGLEALLERGIKDEPAVVLSEGNLIEDGYNAELDRLRALRSNARSILDRLLESERRSSGISSLKLRYNRILGYFFEVTKANLEMVPEHFIRRQSLVGSERFTTDSLAEAESDINNAYERIVELEKQLFLEIRSRAMEQVPVLMELAHLVSEIDVLQSFAFTATLHGYTRPLIADGRDLKIEQGRHPVVEANLPSGSFIPNSLSLDAATGRFVLLTGPNMAGKSTFLRQVGLIVLMAQIGSFVPAEEARIGLVDSIYCRVGASDNLARGESTFLVEMNETAYILRSATERSLLLMDEIGRGTGTNDGLSIAWAVSEYILREIGAKTLFATHYHELAALRDPGILKLTMDVLETEGRIVFLKKVRPGFCDNSYGIHVARLAGLPDEVVERASLLLRDIVERKGALTPPRAEAAERRPSQPQLFRPEQMVLEELSGIDVTAMTPLQALQTIASWQEAMTKRDE